MVINHNIESLTALNYIKQNSFMLNRSLEKLSSGYRINRAGDDPAGLSISEKMRAQIRGLNQASRNVQDAISLIQTAEGALTQDHNMLQRMRELAVQAANDTNIEVDRKAIQAELDQLIEEIDSISKYTSFNERTLLDGSLSGNDNLNKEASDGLKSVLQKEIVPRAVKAICDTYKYAFGYLESSSIGIGLNLYSDEGSRVLAEVAVGNAYNKADKKVIDGMLQYKLSVNTATLKFDDSNKLTEESRTNLETTIVHEMVHALMDESLTNGMIGVKNGVMDSNNKYPKWFSEGMAQTAAGGYCNSNDFVNGSMQINEGTSEDKISEIVKNSKFNLLSDTTEARYGTGYLACMYLGYLASGSKEVNTNTLKEGVDNILSKLVEGKSLNSIIKEKTKYSDINDFQKSFGDADSAKFIAKLTKIVGDKGNGGLVSGNLTDKDLLANSEYSNPLFKLDIDNTNVQNEYPNDKKVYTGGGKVASGDNAKKGPSSVVTKQTAADKASDKDIIESKGSLQIQCGANSNQIININIPVINSKSLGVKGISVLTKEDASDAITKINNAIRIVSEARSSLGAYQNRLEYTIANLDNQAENLQEAESRIRDVDIAKEMMNYSKYNILVQAGEAMLKQSNQSKETVLNLLR